MPYADVENQRKWVSENRDVVRAHSRNSARRKYSDNPDKYRSLSAKYRADNPLCVAISNAKRRAVKDGVPFDIVMADVIVPPTCPVLGIPLERGKGKSTDNSPSIDRIIPALGYVRGNIQVLSTLANRMKNNATFEQLIMLGQWAVRQVHGEAPTVSSRTCSSSS